LKQPQAAGLFSVTPFLPEQDTPEDLFLSARTASPFALARVPLIDLEAESG
jgi:hypothetical protein